jgi:hypothetical protein
MPAIIAVFNEDDSSDVIVDQLSAQGVDRDAVDVVIRDKAIRRIEDVEVTTYVDHFDGPVAEAKKGAVGGVVGGTVAGAGSVFLAIAGVTVFTLGVATLFGTGPAFMTVLAAALAGAVAGGVAGGIIGAILGAADHDATKVKTVETQVNDYVENEGFALTVEVDPDSEEGIAVLLHEVGAENVAVLTQQGKHLRTQLN